MDRESQLKSARQKLKSYRARQSKAGESGQSGGSSSVSSVKRASSNASTSTSANAHADKPAASSPVRAQHVHRRSLSRVSVVMPTTNNRRHSRTSSVLSELGGLINATPAPAPISAAGRRHSRTESISFTTSLLASVAANNATTPAPTQDVPASSSGSLSTWSFPPSPVLLGTPAAAATRRLNRQSLPYPMPKVASPSASPLPSSTSQFLAVSGPTRRYSASGPISPRTFDSSPTPTSSASASTPSTSSSGHARRASKHARKSSLASRRESMELMAGLPVFAGTTGLASYDDEESAMAPTTHRSDALDALEGRVSPARSPVPTPTIELPEDFPTATTTTASRRSSWNGGLGLGAMGTLPPTPLSANVAMQGGKGAIDLGMLVEEEEEGSSSESGGNHAEVVVPVVTVAPAPARRQRPASLCLPPPSPSSRIATALQGPSSPQPPVAVAEVSPSSVSAGGRRPLNLSLSSMGNISTPPTSAGSGLRSLSLNHSSDASSTATPTSPPAQRVAPPSAAAARRTNADAVAMGRRRSSSVVSAAGAAPSSTTSTPSKARSSISYRNAIAAAVVSTRTHEMPGFGELVQAVTPPAAFDHKELLEAKSNVARLENELSASEARAASLAVDLAASEHRTSSLLAAQSDSARTATEELYRAEATLAQLKNEHEAEREERRAELERAQCERDDANAERDDLRDDVAGWRNRCADLQKQVERGQAQLEHERREGAIARDKVRKLGDRLAAAAAASRDDGPDVSEQRSMQEAQAKLITEMRDQIMALAAKLEGEKRERAAIEERLALALSAAAAAADAVASPPMPVANAPRMQHASPRAHTNSDASSVASFGASRASFSFGGNTTADTTMEDMLPSPPAKQAQMLPTANILPPLALGLQTLTEADEDEDDDEFEDIEDDDVLPALEQPTARAFGGGIGSAGSSCSVASDGPPRTPIRELNASPLATAGAAQLQQTQEERDEAHRRSDSFIKVWTFPKGPVAPVRIVSPEDHSFFSIASAEILPPLPVAESVLALPPFFNADLVVDDEYVRRRASAPPPIRTSGLATSGSSSSLSRSAGPPRTAPLTSNGMKPLRTAGKSSISSVPSTSSRSSVASRTSIVAAAAAPPAPSPSRMSLIGGFGSLVASYVAPAAKAVTPAPSPPTRAPSPLPPAPVLAKPAPAASAAPKLISIDVNRMRVAPGTPSTISTFDFTRCAGKDARIIRV